MSNLAFDVWLAMRTFSHKFKACDVSGYFSPLFSNGLWNSVFLMHDGNLLITALYHYTMSYIKRNCKSYLFTNLVYFKGDLYFINNVQKSLCEVLDNILLKVIYFSKEKYRIFCFYLMMYLFLLFSEKHRNFKIVFIIIRHYYNNHHRNLMDSENVLSLI